MFLGGWRVSGAHARWSYHAVIVIQSSKVLCRDRNVLYTWTVRWGGAVTGHARLALREQVMGCLTLSLLRSFMALHMILEVVP